VFRGVLFLELPRGVLFLELPRGVLFLELPRGVLFLDMIGDGFLSTGTLLEAS